MADVTPPKIERIGMLPNTAPKIERIGMLPDAARGAPKEDAGGTWAGALWQGLKGAMSRTGLGQIDAMAAGAQGVSPYAAEKGTLAPDKEQWLYGEQGVVSDPKKFYVARNPQTGEQSVYLRTPESGENRLAAAGRMMAAGVPESFPGTAAGAAARVPSAGQQRLADFERAGVTPNLPAISGSRVAGTTSKVAGAVPFVGNLVRGGATKTLEDTAGAVEREASKLGSAETAEQAGESTRRGITNFIEGTSKRRSDVLYGAFDRLMPGATEVPMTRTLAALRSPGNRFPSNPQLGEQITNPKLGALASTLAPQTKTIPATVSSILDAAGNPIVKAAGQKVQVGGKLSFAELKELRSYIGRQMSNPAIVNDIPRADLSRVYGALTADMRSAAAAQGPEALKALDRATQDFQERMRVIDRITPLLKPDAPEKTFGIINRAAQGGGGDAGLLAEVKSAIGPSSAEWGDVGAAIVRTLGKPSPGVHTAGNPEFSVNNFVTNWNKLSPKAKDILFGPESKEGSPREALERLWRIASGMKDVEKLANTSHTAEFGMTVTGIGAALDSVIFGQGQMVAHALGTMATGYGIAKLVMSPGFSRWLYRFPNTVAKAPNAAVAAQRAAADLDLMMQNRDPIDWPNDRASSGPDAGAAAAHNTGQRRKPGPHDAEPPH